MKKALSIFLLGVFLFNTVGYKALYYFQIRNANKRITSIIQHSEYSSDQLVTIKIPLNLPYLTDWAEFQSMEGQVVYKEQTYRYVKRKIERDSLVLLCLANFEKDRIEKASNAFLLKTNESNASKKAFAKPVKYDFEESSGLTFNTPSLLVEAVSAAFKLCSVEEVFPETSHNPPDRISV